MRGTEVSEFIDLAYTWQERATNAEAENAKLRKVAEAAKKMVKSNQCGYVPGHLFGKLEQALAKLDKEGER